MVHGGDIMGARAVHSNGLGCHINYLERDKKNGKKHTKTRKSNPGYP